MAKTLLTPERLGDHWNFLQPSRPALVTTRNADGSVNVAPFGWNMPVSANPPRVCIALVNSPPNHTLTNILREREFVLNVPTMQVADKLVRASYQHPQGVSKLTAIGFQRLESRVVRTPGVAECRASLECRLHETVPAGDHTLVLGDVVAAAYETDDFTETLMLKADQAWPVIHLDQYKQPQGQVHIFLVPAGLQAINVPYNPR